MHFSRSPFIAFAVTAMIDIAPLVQPVVDRDLNHELLSQLTRTLRRAHLREGIWLGLAAAEIIFLAMLRWVRF